MERLTSNKSVSEMRTYELAYNSCYAKDGRARVRDFKNDFDANELALSVFYQNLWVMANLRERLKDYEDLEEQGKLLKLPCAVGDTVYEINKIRETVSTFTVKGFSVSEHGIFVKWELSEGIYRNLDGFNDDEIGKTVFLTREEAEAALKEL